MNYQALITLNSWWIAKTTAADKKDRIFFLAARHGGWMKDGQQEDFTSITLFELGKEEPIERTWDEFKSLYDNRQIEQLRKP